MGSGWGKMQTGGNIRTLVEGFLHFSGRAKRKLVYQDQNS